MKRIANPLFVGSNPTSAFDENTQISQENSGISAPVTVEKGAGNNTAKLPYFPPTNVRLGCGRVKAGSPFVYFIQAESGGYIKIGRAIDPEMRLREIQAYCPAKLRILAYSRDYKEWELHARFRKTRVHGEWFLPSPELFALIDLINNPPTPKNADSAEEALVKSKAFELCGGGEWLAPDNLRGWYLVTAPAVAMKAPAEFRRIAFRLQNVENAVGYIWRQESLLLRAIVRSRRGPGNLCLARQIVGIADDLKGFGISFNAFVFTKDHRWSDLFDLFGLEVRAEQAYDAARSIADAKAGGGR